LAGQESGKSWLAYSWLFDVAVYGFYRLLGFQGVVLFRLILLFAVLAALHRLIGKRETRFLVAATLSAVAFFALTPLASERWWLLWALPGACVAATLLNPSGIGVYRVVLEYASHSAPLRHVTELKALAFRDPWDWCMLTLAGWAMFRLGKRPGSCFEVLLLMA